MFVKMTLTSTSTSNLLGRVEKKTLLVVALLLDSLLNHLLKFSQEWTAL